MNHEVRYVPDAEAELADIWAASLDRRAVTTAAAWLDHHLARTPLLLGESRTSSVHRVAFHPPLGVEYDVIEDDKLVLVRSVFPIG